MRKIWIRVAAMLLMVPSALALSGPAFANTAPTTVCASGCPFTSIQAAVNAAAVGAHISIGRGAYYENVVVNKPVSLVGSGNQTVIYPAFSGPTCGGGSLCVGASNIILIQANNVTVKNLRLEGDNPNLTSGVIVGGADIDARNGIIEDFNAGVFNGTTVTDVSVSDVYLRGIYVGSSGTGFNITNNTVKNVQGDSSSIAIFNFGGSGVIAENQVSNANDAISANWSTGTRFLDNTVTHSGSGIHTDNNGGFGGLADLIDGNSISNCHVDGYGIFVFAPYLSASVNDNQIRGCAVGLAAFGSQSPGATTTFSKNQVSGHGATTTDSTGTYGAFIVTDLLGYGANDVNATLDANSISGFTTGLFVSQTTTFFGDAVGGQATVLATGNTLRHNQTGANGTVGTVVNAAGNWWGCPQGPNSGSACDTAIGTTQFTPWLTHSLGESDN